MAKILGKTHSPDLTDADTHSLTLINRAIHWLFDATRCIVEALVANKSSYIYTSRMHHYHRSLSLRENSISRFTSSLLQEPSIHSKQDQVKAALTILPSAVPNVLATVCNEEPIPKKVYD